MVIYENSPGSILPLLCQISFLITLSSQVIISPNFHNMRHFGFLFIFLLAQTLMAQVPTDPRLIGLDTLATRILDDWDAPGVSIAIVEKDEVIYAGGFGYRDYEQKLPVTENTLFAIGSCTKAFTVSLIGMLEKDGRLEIDKPVRDYLPELKFKNEYTNTHVTLRDMMCHRTGLPRHDFSWYGSTASREELLGRIAHLEPSFELRERYQYNNFMFMAQGVVVEKLTGKSWEENLKEKILKPLQMDRTNMSVIEMEKVEDRSLAYNTVKGEIVDIPYRNIDAIGPAGSINSCAIDMANWLITWINGGKFKGQEIIPTGFRLQAITAQIAPGGGLPGSENPDLHMSGYGLAWGMSSYRGHYRVEHGGGIDGFGSSTCFFPSDSIGIFVVSNQGNVSSFIRNFIADRMLGLTYRNWGKSQLENKMKADSLMSQAQNADSLHQKKGTEPSHTVDAYMGNYESKGYGISKIFLENDTIWVDHNEGGKRTKTYLEHYHYDIFSARSTEETEENTASPKLSFRTNARGEISSFEVKLEPAVDDIVFEKMAPEMDIKGADLEKYIGDYNLSGITVKVYVRGSDTLMVLVPGQPDYELVPAGEHLFDLKIADGYSVKFDLNDEGQVIQLSFLQPNGVFTAERK